MLILPSEAGKVGGETCLRGKIVHSNFDMFKMPTGKPNVWVVVGNVKIVAQALDRYVHSKLRPEIHCIRDG